jgi:hypothetical protein
LSAGAHVVTIAVLDTSAGLLADEKLLAKREALMEVPDVSTPADALPQTQPSAVRLDGKEICRADLPELWHLQRGGRAHGIGPASSINAIELGVAAGVFSHRLLQSRHIARLFSVALSPHAVVANPTPLPPPRAARRYIWV